MVTRQQRKEQAAEHRRQQILDAALRVFSDKGYGAATVPDIAREAGVAVGTIYNYYDSKRDLLMSLIASYVVTKPFVGLLEQTLEVDDRTFLSSLIEDRLASIMENIDSFLFLLTEVQREPALREQYTEQVLWPILVLLEKYLESRIASGTFRPLDTGITARALGGMMIGLILLWRLEGERSPCQSSPRRDLANQLADLVLTGLRTSPTEQIVYHSA
jgi:AcrR family transcriptional regulator